MTEKIENRPRVVPPCRFRKLVNGVGMCYAVGCCEVGDMACECHDCRRSCEKKERMRKSKKRD